MIEIKGVVRNMLMIFYIKLKNISVKSNMVGLILNDFFMICGLKKLLFRN